MAPFSLKSLTDQATMQNVNRLTVVFSALVLPDVPTEQIQEKFKAGMTGIHLQAAQACPKDGTAHRYCQC